MAVAESPPITVQTFRIGDVRANPFRDIEHYPLQPAKIKALRASINNTDFWPTVVARLHSDGYPEIAFGHHRLAAAREEFGEDGRIPLNIKQLSDERMLKMMADENKLEYAADVGVLLETIRTVVFAYADDRVALDPPHPKTQAHHLRHAPSFTLDLATYPGHPYTANTIAAFLMWDDSVVRDALVVLEEVESGAFALSDLNGMTAHQAEQAVLGVRDAKREAAAHGLDPQPLIQAAASAATKAARPGRRGGGGAVMREAARDAVAAIVNPPLPATPPGRLPTPAETAEFNRVQALVADEAWMADLVDTLNEAATFVNEWTSSHSRQEAMAAPEEHVDAIKGAIFNALEAIKEAHLVVVDYPADDPLYVVTNYAREGDS